MNKELKDFTEIRSHCLNLLTTIETYPISMLNMEEFRFLLNRPIARKDGTIEQNEFSFYTEQRKQQLYSILERLRSA